LIGLDTNILVRYIIQDDISQSARAEQLIESLTQQDQGFFTLVALAEFCWVLTRSYKIKRSELVRTIDWLLEIDRIVVNDELRVVEARNLFANSNADFGDCLIFCCSVAAGCTTVLTFDKSAAKAAGMKLLA